MKRQRWLAKQHGSAHQSSGRAQNGYHGSHLAPGHQQEQRQHSPLSRLVANGYAPTHVATTTQQPYGQRPSSGSRGPAPQDSGSSGYRPSSGSRGPHPDRRHSGGGQFDAAVAGQWSANVRDVQMQRQNRHDPNVAGPTVYSGGQRVTQPAGGGSSIDLSWQEPAARDASGRQPPRMPVAPAQNAPMQGPAAGDVRGPAGGGNFAGTPGAGSAGGLRHQAAAAYVEEHGTGSPWARGPSPSQRPGRAASNTPFGTSCDVPQGGGRQSASRRDAAPPYGVDGGEELHHGSSHRAGSRGVSGRDHNVNAIAAGGSAPMRGRAAGHTAGGASQIVFG